MATLEPTPVVTVDAALAYGDERFAEGAESRQVEVDGLQTDVRNLLQDKQTLSDLVTQVRGERDDARQTLTDHMATHVVTPPPDPEPEPEPPVVAVHTAYGACPGSSGGAAGVLTKFGEEASVRIFSASGLGSVSRPSTATRVHASWKPALGSTITDAQVIAACTNLRDGDLVEVWHEADVKYRKGDDLAAMLALKNQLHDRVVALRNAGRIAKVLTVNTWAGWSVDSTSSVNPANLHCRADILGIDMDGIPAQENFYPFVARQMGAKFVAAYKAGGYVGWSVPEFAMSAVASDANRARRIAWFQSEVAKISQGIPAQGIPAPLMIAWFDAPGTTVTGTELTTANEIAAWSSLVAAN